VEVCRGELSASLWAPTFGLVYGVTGRLLSIGTGVNGGISRVRRDLRELRDLVEVRLLRLALLVRAPELDLPVSALLKDERDSTKLRRLESWKGGKEW